eukprot:CAMPEP_0184698960 /NCGR_PEP_ID=MMETSP0313-20130426/5391_1 /TAXON_ID=2792 /ORGANISM="Porphyridium aerugineum, Strain SAG 1380-2" /LENGTH=319 /DNA_ID=CAMNT_0027157969 /DNA_START=25 /DNA_END=981 /DNA_ORIENTATION=+
MIGWFLNVLVLRPNIMQSIETFVSTCVSAEQAVKAERIQSLWSGYGEIFKMRLEGERNRPKRISVVVKRVAPPKKKSIESNSHLRKLRSYEVETNFYENWSMRCDSKCKVPQFLGAKKLDHEWWIVLEDLDRSGYSERADDYDKTGVKLCLEWLANFHATFLGETPDGLWEIGTYWHLATRPDEHRDMGNEGGLKQAAVAIDRRLNECEFRTLVHGDAKIENFCFTRDMSSVAAVDFQYVGAGAGIKDVAYLLGSGWGGIDEREFEKSQEQLLKLYFSELRSALRHHDKNVDVDALEKEWRGLFPFALADFHRFMAGWA